MCIHRGFTKSELPYTSPAMGNKMKSMSDQFTKVDLDAFVLDKTCREVKRNAQMTAGRANSRPHCLSVG